MKKEKDAFTSDSSAQKSLNEEDNPLKELNDLIKQRLKETGLTFEEYSAGVREELNKEMIETLKKRGFDWEKIKRKED